MHQNSPFNIFKLPFANPFACLSSKPHNNIVNTNVHQANPTESLHPKASPKECAGSVEMIRTSWKAGLNVRMSHLDREEKNTENFRGRISWRGLISEKELVSSDCISLVPWRLKITGHQCNFGVFDYQHCLRRWSYYGKFEESHYIYPATTG